LGRLPSRVLNATVLGDTWGSRMSKAAPKSGQVSTQGRMLYCESQSDVLNAQSGIFEKAGYTVEHAVGRAAAEQALRNGNYDLVVLGHTLTKDDRHHLPYMAKKSGEETQVLVLHASGKHPAVDCAIDSRDGERAVLAALTSLAEERNLVAV
jgi:CheY-like chemotaxis protein